MRMTQNEFEALRFGKKTKRNSMSEKEIQKDIESYIKMQDGFDCIRHDNLGTYYENKWIPSVTPNGYPDIELFYKGRVYFIEVKKVGNKQTFDQVQFENRMKINKIPYRICYCLEDAILFVKQIKASLQK